MHRLYSYKNRYAMEEIHHELKLDLQWRGAPQPAETIKCAASVCEEEIQSVDPAVFSYFKSAAQQLIAVMGAEKAMCAALAKLSGAVMTSGDVLNGLLYFSRIELYCKIYANPSLSLNLNLNLVPNFLLLSHVL